MSTINIAPGAFALPPEPMRRFTVNEYHRMIHAGILTEDDPVELLEGWIVAKMPRNPAHDTAVALVQAALSAILPPQWICRGQSAVTTSDSEPEPDVAVVRGPIRRYATTHPGPADTGMVVEVADSSLARDRTLKARLYARAAVAVYWIVNIPDRQIEVYMDPTGSDAAEPSYQQRRDFAADAAVPLVLEGRTIATIPVAELLP
ncbi:MAG TPA: Uma2 family endonuclease [Gemmataceae bacterium]|nr:Uma2 family endonuclease [Gemmataceae bacterium]